MTPERKQTLRRHADIMGARTLHEALDALDEAERERDAARDKYEVAANALDKATDEDGLSRAEHYEQRALKAERERDAAVARAADLARIATGRQERIAALEATARSVADWMWDHLRGRVEDAVLARLGTRLTEGDDGAPTPDPRDARIAALEEAAGIVLGIADADAAAFGANHTARESVLRRIADAIRAAAKEQP